MMKIMPVLSGAFENFKLYSNETTNFFFSTMVTAFNLGCSNLGGCLETYCIMEIGKKKSISMVYLHCHF